MGRRLGHGLRSFVMLGRRQRCTPWLLCLCPLTLLLLLLLGWAVWHRSGVRPGQSLLIRPRPLLLLLLLLPSLVMLEGLLGGRPW